MNSRKRKRSEHNIESITQRKTKGILERKKTTKTNENVHGELDDDNVFVASTSQKKCQRSTIDNDKPNETNADLYEVLEVERNAQIQEIKASYYRLARIYHPDRTIGANIDAQEKFNQLRHAYCILSNPNTKTDKY